MKNNKIFRIVSSPHINSRRKLKLMTQYLPSLQQISKMSNSANGWLKTIRDFGFSIFSIIAFIILGFIFNNEAISNKYVLKNIEISTDLKDARFEKSNLNPLVISVMQEMLDSTQNAQYSKLNILNSLFEDAIPTQIDGIDIKQIFFFVKKILGIKNHEIKGFIMKNVTSPKDTSNVKLLLHIGDEYSENLTLPKSNVIHFLAETVLQYHSPYELGMYYINRNATGDPVKIQSVFNFMEDLEKKEWMFSNGRWREKRLHIQAYSQLSKQTDFQKTLKNYDYLESLNPQNGAIKLEKAKLYRDVLEKERTDGKKIPQDSINVLSIKMYSICKEIIDKKLTDPDDNGNDETKKLDLMKSQAMINMAFALHFGSKAINSKFVLTKSDSAKVVVESAFKILDKYHKDLSADYWNLKANIELQIKDYKEAEKFIEKATKNNKEGNFYDTYAEILYSKGGSRDVFYSKLDSALIYKDIAKGITVQDYEKDHRWEKIKTDKDFLKVMNKHRKDK